MDQFKKFELEIIIKYIELLNAPLYQTREIVPAISDEFDNKYSLQYQRKEVGTLESGLVFALKLIMPQKFTTTNVTYSIYLVSNTPSAFSKTSNFKIQHNRYVFDSNNPGGYGLEDINPAINCSDIEQDYLNEGLLKIIVKIEDITLKLKQEYMLNKIHIALHPEDFKDTVKLYEKDIALMTASKNKLISDIDTAVAQSKELQDNLTKFKEQTFNPVNKKLEIISEVNGRLILRARSLEEHIIDVTEQLEESNIHEFLKNLKIEDFPIHKLTRLQKEILLKKILILQVKVTKRLTDEQNCSICMDRRPDTVLQPCQHVYCGTCIVENCSTSNICPKCISPFVNQVVLNFNS